MSRWWIAVAVAFAGGLGAVWVAVPAAPPFERSARGTLLRLHAPSLTPLAQRDLLAASDAFIAGRTPDEVATAARALLEHEPTEAALRAAYAAHRPRFGERSFEASAPALREIVRLERALGEVYAATHR